MFSHQCQRIHFVLLISIRSQVQRQQLLCVVLVVPTFHYLYISSSPVAPQIQATCFCEVDALYLLIHSPTILSRRYPRCRGSRFFYDMQSRFLFDSASSRRSHRNEWKGVNLVTGFSFIFHREFCEKYHLECSNALYSLMAEMEAGSKRYKVGSTIQADHLR